MGEHEALHGAFDAAKLERCAPRFRAGELEFCSTPDDINRLRRTVRLD